MADSMENPPPIPALPLGYYAPKDIRKRPVLLSIIAWVAIIFGGLGSLGILSSAIMLLVQHYTGLFGNPGQPASSGTPIFLTISRSSI